MFQYHVANVNYSEENRGQPKSRVIARAAKRHGFVTIEQMQGRRSCCRTLATKKEDAAS